MGRDANSTGMAAQILCQPVSDGSGKQNCGAGDGEKGERTRKNGGKKDAESPPAPTVGLRGRSETQRAFKDASPWPPVAVGRRGASRRPGGPCHEEALAGSVRANGHPYATSTARASALIGGSRIIPVDAGVDAAALEAHAKEFAPLHGYIPSRRIASAVSRTVSEVISSPARSFSNTRWTTSLR
mgnify:CR=1 FL=1